MSQIEKIFCHPDLTIRSLATQDVARRIYTDFLLTECFFSLTEGTDITDVFGLLIHNESVYF